MLGLASELKCETVAEGIETDDQRLFLQKAA
jgi:sensor c-di-GMP phosphodiesterase-like protein